MPPFQRSGGLFSEELTMNLLTRASVHLQTRKSADESGGRQAVNAIRAVATLRRSAPLARSCEAWKER